jgi:hypothetical protein
LETTIVTRKAAKTTTSQLQSATARLKLKPQARAYFVKVADAAWVGYRKPLRGPGSWVARVKGWEKTLWGADDNGLKADGEKVLNFWQAKTEVQKLSGRTSRADATTPDNSTAVLTVDEALTAYGPTLLRRGARAFNAKKPRRHLSDALLSKPITLLTKKDLEGFRDGMLEKGLAPSSVNRIMACLRAALTQADKTRIHIWRGGLKALPDATEANNVVIEDEAKAQQWVAEAYALDRRPWDENDPSANYRSDVRKVVEAVGLDPDVYVMYAFRHTSITRMLLAGTPTEVVAKTHDTSETMIRKHYAASILDFSDAMTRKTLPALGPAQLAASNVVPLAKR